MRWLGGLTTDPVHGRRAFRFRNRPASSLFLLCCSLSSLLILVALRPAGAQESSPDSAVTALKAFAVERRILPVGAAVDVMQRSTTDDPHRSLRLDGHPERLAGVGHQIGAEEGSLPEHNLRNDPELASFLQYVEHIGAGSAPVILAKVEKKAKAPVSTAPATADSSEASYVGAQACLGCHVAQAAAFGTTLMGKIFRNPRNPQERANCETCHGPGSLHVKAGGGRGVGGMISFRLDDAAHTTDEYNAICLSCHEKGNRVLWRGSTHETRGLACINCHTVMTNVTPRHQLSQLTELDTCFQCHKNKRAEIWRSSHMPLREGKMTCSSCHNPHGSYSEAMLKETTVNDNCYKCHAEKRGPFLWEHPPVRENCMNCHEAHGSNNDFLLKISRPRLCQQCHATLVGHPGNPRNPKSVYAINRECQNCHSQHHGSNSPAGSRFIR